MYCAVCVCVCVCVWVCRLQRVLPTCNGGEWIRKYVSTLVAHVIASCCSSSSTTTSNWGCNRCGVWCCMCNQSTHHFVLAIRLRLNQLTDELQQRYHRECIEEIAKEKEEVEEEEQREDTLQRRHTERCILSAFWLVDWRRCNLQRICRQGIYKCRVCNMSVCVPSLYMYIGKKHPQGNGILLCEFIDLSRQLHFAWEINLDILHK